MDEREASAPVTVLAMAPSLGSDLSYLAVDPRVVVLDGTAAFASEVHDDDPGGRAPEAEVPREERDRLLGRAEVLVIGYPVPRSIAGRAPRLRWAHHTQAGVSNLHRSDLWSSTVTLTSSRGTVSARAIAEYAIAAVLFSARGLDEASRQKHEGRFTRRGYRMRTVSGSTIGIVGLGGIGREVGRMAQTLGLRVLATRASVDAPEHDVDGADLVLPADQLLDVAAQSDFLVVCSQLTERTRRMIDGSVFAAMPTHAVLVNIARGEEVDEDALLNALEHEQIAGAVLDVRAGELDGGAPRPALVEHPRILLTPHLSGMGDGAGGAPGRELVADNLRRYLAGEPMRNVVDRSRGY
ncbi:MAG TPA: NAD(P)-dependent oxidoreductase [Acidimicrobiales bacterium]